MAWSRTPCFAESIALRRCRVLDSTLTVSKTQCSLPSGCSTCLLCIWRAVLGRHASLSISPVQGAALGPCTGSQLKPEVVQIRLEVESNWPQTASPTPHAIARGATNKPQLHTEVHAGHTTAGQVLPKALALLLADTLLAHHSSNTSHDSAFASLNSCRFLAGGSHATMFSLKLGTVASGRRK